MAILEDIVEEAAILWLQELGFQYLHGNDIAPDGPSKERDSYADVILEGRFKSALSQLNSHLDSDVLDDVARRVLRPASPSLEESNHAFHQMLTKGVEVQVRKDDQVRGDLAQLIDFSDPEKYPHTADDIKMLCDAFNRFDCKQHYESDQASLELVHKTCNQNTYHTEL